MKFVAGMVDMRRDPQEEAEAINAAMPATPTVPDYPYGLTGCFCDDELEKLNLDTDDVQVGDMLEIHAMAKVTSVSKNETSDGVKTRIEWVLAYISADDDETDDEPRRRR